MGRDFAFSLKEWHNLILLTLAHDPLIILCTHKPQQECYSHDQYLPHDKWDECLRLYKQFFTSNRIPYVEYDYIDDTPLEVFSILDTALSTESDWWEPIWCAGYGFIGSHNPDYVLVAERIGPNNMNNLPFETGPTGHMLSNMLSMTKTPLGKFAVTNMVKSFRRDTRPPTRDDADLLKIELSNLKPKVVVFMGSIAKAFGSRVAEDLGIHAVGMTHFGYYSHRGIYDVSMLSSQWQKIINIKEADNEQTGHRTIISST